jgi:hypothetical protein
VRGNGQLTSVLRHGVPAGLGFGLLRYAIDGSLGRAIFGAVFFAAFFGPTMAFIQRRRWPGSAELAADDRLAVERAVQRGEGIGDERLAGAVVALAEVVRTTEEREARQSWVLVLFAAGTLAYALAATFDGSTREVIVFWALTAFWIVAILWWFPRQRRRRLENARKAATAVTGHIDHHA